MTDHSADYDAPIIHEPGCGWETGPHCTCGADPERSAEKDECPECGLPADYCACALVFDRPWRVDLQCCARHHVTEFFPTWETADQFRESYCTGVAVDPHGYSGDGYSGHQRAGIVTDTSVTPPGNGRDL